VSKTKKRKENQKKKIQKHCEEAKEERERHGKTDMQKEQILIEPKIPKKNLAKPLNNKFQFTLLPHELKHHGPAERHLDPQKYSAPEKLIHLIGDVIQKQVIFNRCKNNNKIKSEPNNNEERLKILSNIIPTIIVDECVASDKLLEKIQKSGYDVCFLGRKLSDEEIYKKMLEIKGILVTEDQEFHLRVYRDKFVNDPIFVSRNSEQVMQNLGIIERAMKKFES
jgi:hypothetical protein